MPKQGLALELEKRREKEPTLVALAALPGGACRRATVLLGPADAGTYIAYVIDDDPGKLPVGQVRIHNLSPLTIAMRCNGKPAQELKTRETLLVPPKTNNSSTNSPTNSATNGKCRKTTSSRSVRRNKPR